VLELPGPALTAAPMTLSIFIKSNMDAIVQEWLEFDMTM
jgi:hypothetical protein